VVFCVVTERFLQVNKNASEEHPTSFFNNRGGGDIPHFAECVEIEAVYSTGRSMSLETRAHVDIGCSSAA
jgi:hypothetical protein